jgi:small subunit ribosomal protein S20
MANIKSAKKQARRAQKRRMINMDRKSSIKTDVRKLLNAIEKGESVENVQTMFRTAEAVISRAKRKIMHVNTASRKISRLAKKVSEYAKAQKA